LHFSTVFKKGEEDKQIFIILGNGHTEEKILRYLAPKFDGTQYSLVYTSLPIQMKYEKRTGLSAIKALASALTFGCRIRKCLFLIDREHIPNSEVIVKEFSEYGFKIEKCEEMEDKVKIFRLTRGPLTVDKFYLIVAGETKSIDEELVSLARQVYKKDLKIDDFKWRLKELFNKATLEQVANTLRGLYIVLRKIREECESS
jgi:hypothetical protein